MRWLSHQNHGLYPFIPILLGLRSAHSTFQRTTDVVLYAVKCQFALVYTDDVVIFSRSPTEHIANVGKFLTVFNNTEVTINLKNYSFVT